MLCQDRFLNWKWRELSENRTPEGQGCFVRSDSPWTRTVDAESQKHEPPDKLITRQLVRISYNLLSVFRKYRLGCVYTSINNVPVSDGSGPKRSATVRSHRRADGNESEQTEKPTAQNAADNTDDQVQPESRSVAFDDQAGDIPGHEPDEHIPKKIHNWRF